MTNLCTEAQDSSVATEFASKKKIIVAPIDIANGMTQALEFSVQLAEKWQANLYVMYVYPEVPRVSAAKLIHAVPSVDWERHRLSVQLYKLVDRLRERYPRILAYFTDNDCPAEAIQKAANNLAADLIVVSAHDRGWLAKLLLYSDANAIARRSGTPVLIYRPKLIRRQGLDVGIPKPVARGRRQAV
jgi:nucleotide-binding universal stress UspA family protein